MKQAKIITFTKLNGERTSITLTNFQTQILEALAEKNGVQKTEYLQNIVKDVEKGKNVSSAVRDYILLQLVIMLAIKGVKLQKEEKRTPLTRDEIIKLMQSPRYWRDQEPEIVQMVNDGFARIYGRFYK